MIAQCQNSRCGTTLQIADQTGETRIRCLSCGYIFTVPAAPSFVIFDLETTGLSCQTCEIIQIAAVRFRNGAAVKEDSFFSFCRPQARIPSFISYVATPES